jgi:hypothetical protein
MDLSCISCSFGPTYPWTFPPFQRNEIALDVFLFVQKRVRPVVDVYGGCLILFKSVAERGWMFFFIGVGDSSFFLFSLFTFLSSLS